MTVLRRIEKEETGMALILSLLVISLLAGSVVTFFYERKVDLSAAENMRDKERAYYLARAGVQAAMLVLEKDETAGYDCLQDGWANLPEYLVLSSALLEEGAVSGGIVDLESRINVNRLVKRDGKVSEKHRRQMERLFDLMGFDTSVIDAIIDWIDPDDDPLPGGAENDYYSSLPFPYPCKNGPMDSISELRLVKGVTDEMYFGKEGRTGLKDLLTANSGGRININTASPLILQAIGEGFIGREEAEEIVRYRKENPFVRKSDIMNVPGIGIGIFSKISPVITVKSGYFLVKTEGRVGRSRSIIETVVRRSKSGVTSVIWSAR